MPRCAGTLRKPLERPIWRGNEASCLIEPTCIMTMQRQRGSLMNGEWTGQVRGRGRVCVMLGW